MRACPAHPQPADRRHRLPPSCSAEHLRALLERTLGEHGHSLADLDALASIDGKRDEPGLRQLATLLERPVHFLAPAVLHDYEPRLLSPPPSRCAKPAAPASPRPPPWPWPNTWAAVAPICSGRNAATIGRASPWHDFSPNENSHDRLFHRRRSRRP
ncbi:cobalamin biosynthesis protein [Pseudomonas aeruginosa]|nr:cobalamin biosynthesis protein [Pseudomonas aeruginosa]